MRRNENQPRPTAGCLSVPLFNQKKRSRLPLTSNPSENEMYSGNSLGYAPALATTNRAPLTQRSEWNQQTNLRPEQGKTWPSTSSRSTGQGYSPIPHPHKPIYNRSGTGMQRPSGKYDSMAMTQNCRVDAFPSVSGAYQAQERPFVGKQPIKQQTFSRQANPPKASFTHQKPMPGPSHSQGAGPQSQNTKWKVKSVGHTSAGMWVEDTFGTSRNESSAQQEKSTETKPGPENSLRILTAVIEGMKHWSQFKDKVPMLFEIFATLDSAVTVGKYGAKNFLMRDGKDVVSCVYYETDQVLPRLIRGQVHRCVGNYDRQKNILTCVSVRPASSSEQRNAQEAVKASDAEMRSVVQVLSEM
uniref:Spermatogenesis associated 22 n=1 Tax=Astyanax mexicanus TaxID=7994 RepID=A0A3B1KLC5_ASTMX